MSLAGIKAKILDQAEKEKKNILEAVKLEAQKFDQESEEKITKIHEEFNKEIEKLKRDLREQARIRGELQARNNILKKKQALIDQVFEKVLRDLSQHSEEERKKLLRKFLEEAEKELGSEMNIVATKKDREAIKSLARKYRGVKLSVKNTQGRGGFIAANKEIEQDYTLDNIVSEKREELESEIAKLLFS